MDEFDEEEVFEEEEWVEETIHEQTPASAQRPSQLVADSSHEYDEFVEEEFEEEVEEVEEVYEDEDALSDEQFLSKLHTSFQEMAAKSKQQPLQHHQQSSFRSLRSHRSNSLASIKEEDRFGAGASNVAGDSVQSGSYSADDSASVEFDLGSYQDDSSGSSHDVPEDYEQACRNLIAIVKQGEQVDADDIIRRCDLPNLYKNLKQQHRHMRNKTAQAPQESADSPWEPFDKQDSAFIGTSFQFSSPHSEPKGASADWAFDDDQDPWGFDQPPKSATTNDMTFMDANRLPRSSQMHTDQPTQVSDEEFEDENDLAASDQSDDDGDQETPQIEKWLERDADDPEDYEDACRKLIAILYQDDEDHDPDTMIRRSVPRDLYRYLKNQYWFLEHTGLINEKVVKSEQAADANAKVPKLEEMIQNIKRPVRESKESGSTPSAAKVAQHASLQSAEDASKEVDEPMNDEIVEDFDEEPEQYISLEDQDASNEVDEPMNDEIVEDFDEEPEQYKSLEDSEDVGADDDEDASNEVDEPMNDEIVEDFDEEPEQYKSLEDSEDVGADDDEDASNEVDEPMNDEIVEDFDEEAEQYKSLEDSEDVGADGDENASNEVDEPMNDEIVEDFDEEPEQYKSLEDQDACNEVDEPVNDELEEVFEDEPEQYISSEDTDNVHADVEISAEHAPPTNDDFVEALEEPPGQYPSFDDTEDISADGNNSDGVHEHMNDVPGEASEEEPRQYASLETDVHAESEIGGVVNETMMNKSGRPSEEPKLEKWLERNADDPEDYVLACRKLATVLYKDDEERDIDTMLRRTPPPDLYRYLKNEYWYHVHQGNLNENDIHTIQLQEETKEPDEKRRSHHTLERRLSQRAMQEAPAALQQSASQPISQSNASVTSAITDPVSADVFGKEAPPTWIEGLLDETSSHRYSIKGSTSNSTSIESNDTTRDTSRGSGSWNHLDTESGDESSVESGQKQPWSKIHHQSSDKDSAREATRSLLEATSEHDDVEEGDYASHEDDHSISDAESEAQDEGFDHGEAISNVSVKRHSMQSDDSENKRLRYSENMQQEAVTEKNKKIDEASRKGNQALVSPGSKPMSLLSFSDRTQESSLDQIIEDEMLLMLKQAEEELGESFDDETMDILIMAAKEVAYCKMYYDVFNDKYIYLPPVAKTIMDYSLLDIVESTYDEESDGFPIEFSAVLRSVAAQHLESLDLDLEYMEKLAVRLNSEVAFESTIAYEDVVDDSTAQCQTSIDQFVETGQSEACHSSIEKAPMSTNQKPVVSDTTQVEPKATDVSYVAHGLDVDIRDDDDVPENDEVDTPHVAQGVGHLIDATEKSKSTESSQGDSNWLQEMAQMLEFKRRVDKAKLSKEMDELHQMRSDFEMAVANEKRRLSDDRRLKVIEIEESAKVLAVKYNADTKDAEIELRNLLSAREADMNQIATKIQEAQDRIERETRALGKETLVHEERLLQLQQHLQDRVITARNKLETERQLSEEALRDDPMDEQQNTGGFLGMFGARQKAQDLLEKERAKQARFMQWKLREMELEKEISDLEEQQQNLKNEQRTIESAKEENQAALKGLFMSLEEQLFDHEEEQRALDEWYRNEEVRLSATKEELDSAYAENLARITEKKNEVERDFNDGLMKLTEEAQRQKRILLEAEEKFNANATALKDKWLREEAALLESATAQQAAVQGNDASAQGACLQDEEEVRVKDEEKWGPLRSGIEAQLNAAGEAHLDVEEAEALKIAKEQAAALKIDEEAAAASKAKAEEEARLKAEEEAAANARAEEEARLKAEEEAAANARAEEEARLKAEEEANAKARVEEDARLKAEEEANAKARVEEEARLKAEEEAAANARAEEEARLKAEEEAAANARAEEEARLKAEEEANAKARVEEDARLKAEEEANAKARVEEDARLKAEEEANAKARVEEEARLKAEEEAAANARAEEEARLKAEEEAAANARAEEEARLKAEEEANAKARVEEDARLKAEEEANAKARVEEDARLKAEEEAAAKARAEEEARLKAEDEAAAKARAEKEARLKAEDEAAARARVEENARLKAEEEATARARVEEDARLKAEEAAAEAKAEEEARLRAEEEAAARARVEEDARLKAEEAAAAAEAKAEAEARLKAEEEAAAKACAEEAARLKVEEEAAALKIAAEEAAAAAAKAEEEARLKAEEEAAARARMEEDARLKAEEEAAALKIAEEEAAAAAARAEEEARLKAEEEAVAKARAEEAARLKAKEEAAAMKTAEEEAASAKARAEEEARLKAEEEAAVKARAEEAAALKIAEEEAAAKARAEEEARLTAEEEAAALKIAEEEAAAAKSKAEEEARLKAESEAAAHECAEEESRLKSEEEAVSLKIAEEEAAAVKAKVVEEDVRMAAERETAIANEIIGADEEAKEEGASAKAISGEEARNKAEEEVRLKVEETTASATAEVEALLKFDTSAPSEQQSLHDNRACDRVNSKELSSQSTNPIGLEASPKRKQTRGGGLGGRLIKEAQMFVLESSTKSFSESFTDLGATSEFEVNEGLVGEPSASVISEGSHAGMGIGTQHPRVLVLLSSTPTTRAQEVNQEKSLVILRALGLEPECIDGADPNRRDFREDLLRKGGKRGAYPQFYVTNNKQEHVFFGDFDALESANENGEVLKRFSGSWHSPKPSTTQTDPRGLQWQSIVNHEHSMKHTSASVVQKRDESPELNKSFETHVGGGSVVRPTNPLSKDQEKSNAGLVQKSITLFSDTKGKSSVQAEQRVEQATNMQDKEEAAVEPSSAGARGLAWWRQNGKRMVDEKLAAKGNSSSGTSEGIHEKQGEDNTGGSLAEKRRLIAERRKRALSTRASLSSVAKNDNIATTAEVTQHAISERANSEETTSATSAESRKLKESPAFLGRLQGKSGPLGSARALSWAKEAGGQESAQNRLEFWKQNDKRTDDDGKESQSLEEKRRKAAEARARAIAARNGSRQLGASPAKPAQTTQRVTVEPTKSVEDSNRVQDVDEVSQGIQKISQEEARIESSAKGGMKAERLAEAQRLAEKSARAREARLEKEAELADETRQVRLRGMTSQNIPEALDSSGLDASVSELQEEVSPSNKVKSALVPQMVREADRLSGFIRRYEKKLETVCKSLLSVAQQYESDDEAETAKGFPLHQMYDFVVGRDWFRRNSTNEDRPSFILWATELNSNYGLVSTEDPSENSILKLSPLGLAFVAMDGPTEGDLGRFLSSLRGSDEPLSLSNVRRHWADVVRLSGDVQSRRVEKKLNELVKFGLQAHIIEIVGES